MRRKSGLRAAFVVTLANSALLGGCSDDGPPPPPCPTSVPAEGGACLGSPLPYCNYAFECPGNVPGSSAFECVSGRWVSRGTAKCNPPFDGGPTGDVFDASAAPDADASASPDADASASPDADASAAPDADASTSSDADASTSSDADASTSPDADVAAPTCPATAPTIGDACAGSPVGRCGYSFPCPGSTPGTTIFECSMGRWSVFGTAKCNPPFDGGATGDVPRGG